MGGGRLLRVELPQLPAGGHGQHHVPLKLDRVHRVEAVRLAVGRRVRVEDRREVRSGLRRREHRLVVAPQLREQVQRRHEFGDASPLLRPVLPEHVDDVFCRHGDRLLVDGDGGRVARMPAENPVRDGVSPGVVAYAVALVLPVRQQALAPDSVRLDHGDVQLDPAFQSRVVEHHGEGLAVLAPRHPHRPQLLRKTDCLRPPRERGLDSVVEPLVLAEHLQARTRSHGVVGQHQHKPPRVGVVRHLVARAHPQNPPHLGRGVRVRREGVRRRPVPRVVGSGLRRVEAGFHCSDDRPGPRGAEKRFQSVEHPHAPECTIFLMRSPPPRDFAASLEAR